MKGAAILMGLGILAAGGVALAMSGKGVTLVKGGVYTWVDKRGFPAADTKAQYESLGFGSVSLIEVVGGWGVQGIWLYDETLWDIPEGLTTPEYEGKV